MLIRLTDIRRAGGAISEHADLPLPDVAAEHSSVVSLTPVHVEVAAELMEQVCRVTGELSATVTYRCSRCLDEFSAPLQVELEETFTGDENQGGEDIQRISGDEILLNPYIEEAINLAVEARPLCSETCKGLCPECGCNRNHDKCTCEGTTIDPRWEALQDLLSVDKSE